MLQVLETAGFEAPRIVEQQEQPDPDFPTVAFPNPEEPGAMDLALASPRSTSADLVVANDPDADRCAAAVPTPHGWRMLRGDEVGALLGAPPDLARPDGHLRHVDRVLDAARRMARAAGQPYVETLTGFKWIGRVPGLAFGYEEALGYCCDPEHVKDKDGVSALLLLCELAAETKAAGRTLVDVLDDLAVSHGLHATDQLSVRVADLSLIAAAMERLRAATAALARRARGRARRRPGPGQRRPAAHRRPALPAGRRRPGRRPARAAPSPSSSATSRSSSRSTPRPAWTPRGSRRRPGWTPSSTTSGSRSACEAQTTSATTNSTVVAASAAISGHAGSRRTPRASASASAE